MAVLGAHLHIAALGQGQRGLQVGIRRADDNLTARLLYQRQQLGNERLRLGTVFIHFPVPGDHRPAFCFIHILFLLGWSIFPLFLGRPQLVSSGPQASRPPGGFPRTSSAAAAPPPGLRPGSPRQSAPRPRPAPAGYRPGAQPPRLRRVSGLRPLRASCGRAGLRPAIPASSQGCAPPFPPKPYGPALQ